MASIFLSHSKQDRTFARRLARDVSKRGHRVWIDEAEIKIGDSLLDKIRKGIDQADFLGVVVSQASVASKWVRVEVEIAMTQEIAGRRVKVLPMLLDNVQLPSYLTHKRYADFTVPSGYRQALKEVLARLNDHSTSALAQQPMLATTFWEFSHNQSSAPDAEDVTDGGAEGHSWFEFEILECTKEKLRSHRIGEWKTLPQLVDQISPTLAVLTGRDTRQVKFGLLETVQWAPTEFWPWLHRQNIAAYDSAPRDRPYDGFMLEIKRTNAVFQPWLDDNVIEQPEKREFQRVLSQLQQPLMQLICAFLEIEPNTLLFGRLREFVDLPEHGGFGYAMAWSRKIQGAA